MEVLVNTLCLLPQPKGQQQFKNKKQPELTENRTVWKSNNQGDKEEPFIQTSRMGGDRQPGQRGLVARRWLAEPTVQPRAPARGNKASNLWLKTPVGVEVAAGETPSLTGEVIGETHRGLECAQAHPLGNQHQRGRVWLWVSEWKTEIRRRVRRAPLLPLGPSPTYSVTAQRPDQCYPAPVNT